MLEERQNYLPIFPILNDTPIGSPREEVIREDRGKSHGKECQRGVPGTK